MPCSEPLVISTRRDVDTVALADPLAERLVAADRPVRQDRSSPSRSTAARAQSASSSTGMHSGAGLPRAKEIVSISPSLELTGTGEASRGTGPGETRRRFLSVSAPKMEPPTVIVAATVRPSVGADHRRAPLRASSAKNPPGLPPVAKTTSPTTSGVAWFPSPRGAAHASVNRQPAVTRNARTPLPSGPPAPKSAAWAS